MDLVKIAQNRKQSRTLIIIASLVIPIVIIILRYIPNPDLTEGTKTLLYGLPLLNAVLNGSTFLLLIAALVAIKRKNIARHKKLVSTAMIFSGLFLISYIAFHGILPETPYGEGGNMKTVYYLILVTHILLSAIIVPLALTAYSHGLAGRIDLHRKIVKFAFPFWLYVTITGVIVYIMIQPFYEIQLW
ncbi:MAG: putative membrane protein [Flavobacteriales bacterium]|jgi:putative membrane protein